MKIVHYIDGLLAGGKERQLVAVLRALLAQHDHDLHVVTMTRKVHYEEILTLPVTLHYVVRQSARDPHVFVELYRLCREIRPDLIHTWDPMTSLYAIPASRLLHVPLLNGMIRNAPNMIRPLSKLWFYRWATLPFSDKILANSRAGLAAYGVPPEKGSVVYNGFDFSRITSISEPSALRSRFGISARRIVGMVASFSPAKDYTTFILAADLVAREFPDVLFLAIGDGPQRTQVEDFARRRNIRNVLFTGTTNEVESLVSLFDIGVLMSFTEGISNAILEYMALGKPVIATAVQGNLETVEDGISGFLVPVSDPEALAGKIITLLRDPQRLQSMGCAGKQRVADVFSMEQMCTSLLQVYHQAVGTRRLS